MKQFSIRQDRCAMKVTTDSCLLGAYAGYVSAGRILDIGTGTGILSLMAAQRFPKSTITAVEIDERASRQAGENFRDSPWEARLRLIHTSIQEYAMRYPEHRSIPVARLYDAPDQEQGSPPGWSFDLIICNPPYYENQLQTTSVLVNIARHSAALTMSELCRTVNEIISKTGSFYTILPPETFHIYQVELSKYNMQLHDMLVIRYKPGMPEYRIIGGFSANKLDFRKDDLSISDISGAFSKEFRSLLREFYLAF